MKINHEETKNTKKGAAKQYNAEFTAAGAENAPVFFVSSWLIL